MVAANRIRPLDVFQKHEWENLSARQNWRGPYYVFHAWLVIASSMVLVAVFPNLLSFILAVMLTGSRQLGIAILMHEAAHGALHPNRKINDFLGHWLCAAPVGASLAPYRKYHLSHHKYVQQPEDPDIGLSAAFPVTKASMRRKIIRDLTGQTFVRQRLQGFNILKTNTAKTNTPKPKSANKTVQEKSQTRLTSQPSADEARQTQAEVVANKTSFRDHFCFNIILLLILTLAGYWWLYPSVWLLALATWFPLVTRIRNIAEHACVRDSEDPLAHARTIHANWVERIFIAPYFVNFHSEHHAFMHLPCYRLPLAHKMLDEKGYGQRIPQAVSYRDVLGRATI